MKIGNTSVWHVANRIPTIYGTLIALGLITFFFVMYLVGLVHTTELRLLNLLIVLPGVYFALKQYQTTHRDRMDYFHAFTTGMGTAAIGTTTFAVFLLIYLHIDKNLMQSIAEQEPLGFYLNPYIASFIVFLEGLFSGLFVTFLLSNFLAARTPANPMKDKSSEIIQ